MSLDPASSASHFWQIGELLDYLFERCPVADLASCARVSKLFHSHASDHLYKNVSKIQNVFQFLGPVAQQTFRQEDGKLNFAYYLQPHIWERFIPYGERVRSMEYDESKLPLGCQLVDFCFNEIAATCPTAKVFPSLLSATLVWRGIASRGRFSINFLGESLRRLSVDCDADTLKYFLGSIHRIARNLESFHLACANSLNDTEAGLLALINGLPTLKEVTLPSHLLSTEVLLALSTHPHIESLHRSDSQSSTATSTNTPKGLNFPEGGFERLRKFKADTDLADMISWLQSGPIPPSLTTLHVCSRTLETNANIDHCFTHTSKALPHLTVLILDFTTHNTAPEGTTAEVAGNTFKSLSGLKHLEVFTFDHPAPLLIPEDHIAQMVKAWPALQSFAMRTSSVCADEQSILSMGILVTLAQSCPKLRSLSFVVNTKLAPSQNFSKKEGFAYPFFELDLGCSPIADARAVATFLSQVLPENASVTYCDKDPSTMTTSAALQATLTSRQQCWKEVTNWLGPLIGARAREKDAETKVKSITAELDLAKQENAELKRKLENLSRSIKLKSAPTTDYGQS
ncbi:hypothetical protein SISNIDRAFT_543068 [Sistotremastrum niveocremeum HHB9708]|uniref:F-box domain-containing protein n=1 Tax=Sistotremastrum niveocremeum HHB9708 TaxID=1314777 RepID=A0A164WKJ7_9AGAM|nr:hypothetical protein SISNIDRAFT_543068 [Sistotremastrum niveocremeum HHB9708]